MEHDDPVRQWQRALQSLLPGLDLARPAAPGAPEGQRAALLGLLQALMQAAPARPPLQWINASIGQQLRLIPVREVLYFQADTKYTRVVTAGGEALIRKPLKELQDELDAGVFWPIHRSTIVNAHAIGSVARDERGRVFVRLKQRDERLAVSEGHIHRFRQM